MRRYNQKFKINLTDVRISIINTKIVFALNHKFRTFQNYSLVVVGFFYPSFVESTKEIWLKSGIHRNFQFIGSSFLFNDVKTFFAPNFKLFVYYSAPWHKSTSVLLDYIWRQKKPEFIILDILTWYFPVSDFILDANDGNYLNHEFICEIWWISF